MVSLFKDINWNLLATTQHEIERSRRIQGFSESSKVASDNGESLNYAAVPYILNTFMERILYSGITNAQLRKMIMLLVVTSIFASLVAILLGSFLPLLILPIAFFIFERTIAHKSFVRAECFERDYTALLLSLSSAVKTGLDPLQALAQAVDLFKVKSELHTELKKLQNALEQGISEEEAITSFAKTIHHPDIALFRTAFILARREGSSLSLCLQRLAKVTRTRQSFRRKIKAAVAMQRLSSIGIAGCALVIISIQAITNPQSLSLALHHPMGLKLLTCGAFLVSIGVLWMLRLTRTKV